MRKSVFFAVLLVLSCAGQGRCGIIVQTVLPNMRFASAEPQISAEHPLQLAVEVGNETAVLQLGRYSGEDVGKTFTFDPSNTGNRDIWDAVIRAIRERGLGTFWLGRDPSPQTTFFLAPGLFPNFNLQQIDVMPNYYRTWDANGYTYRTASITATLHWLIPEPATWMLGASVAALLALRRQLPGQPIRRLSVR